MKAVFIDLPSPIGDPQWVNIHEIAVVRPEPFPSGSDGALVTVRGGAHVATLLTVDEVMSELEAIAARAANSEGSFE